MTKPRPETYTSSEAAKEIGCALVTIRQNVHRGKLEPIRKAGSTYLFAASEVLRFKSHYTGKK